MASIYSIVIQPENMEYGENIKDYIRVPLDEAQLVAGHGIAGDQKAGRHPRRQVNLLSCEWLEELQPAGYKTLPGQFGEQLILRGLDVLSLKPGDVIRLGETAEIEITKPRTGCTRLEAAQRKPCRDVLGPIGMLAKVIRSGVIRIGDPVRVLEKLPA